MAGYPRLLIRAAHLWWRVRQPRTLGVRVVLLAPDDRVALVRHSYGDHWYLPGGGVEKGEAADAGMRREVTEEIALADITIERVLGVYHSRREGKDDHVFVFVAHADAAAAARLRANDRHEIAEAGWFALDALPDAVSPATRRRLDEHRAGTGGYGAW